MSRDLDLEMRLKSWRQFVQIFRCYVWSEERGKVVEFSPVSNQNISLSSNILSYWNMYWKKPQSNSHKILEVNKSQGNETDSRPSSRAGSPSKLRKISGGTLSRWYKPACCDQPPLVTGVRAWTTWTGAAWRTRRTRGSGSWRTLSGSRRSSWRSCRWPVCPPWPINHFYHFGFQRKMQLAEDNDQPNSLQESEEIPDLWTHFWQFGAKCGASHSFVHIQITSIKYCKLGSIFWLTQKRNCT